MVAHSRLAKLEKDIEALHERRFVPPLLKWITEQDTETLTILRDRLEAGQDIVTAMKGLSE